MTNDSWEWLTESDWIRMARAVIKRWSELVLADLDRDLTRLTELDVLDRVYLRAYWMRVCHEVVANRAKVEVPVSDFEQFTKQLSLIEEFYHIQLKPRPSSDMKADVLGRMEALKQRLAYAFENRVRDIVDRFEITSPIEQIFLLEWCYSHIEDVYSLRLEPQKNLDTPEGTCYLDFLVSDGSQGSPQFSIAIELDGHEFHEKSKEQVAHDKRRERAVLFAGIEQNLAVLRFSGREVVRNCHACIEEIIRFVKARRAIQR